MKGQANAEQIKQTFRESIGIQCKMSRSQRTSIKNRIYAHLLSINHQSNNNTFLLRFFATILGKFHTFPHIKNSILTLSNLQ